MECLGKKFMEFKGPKKTGKVDKIKTTTSRRVKNTESLDNDNIENTDDDLLDDVGRVWEVVNRNSQSKLKEQRVTILMRSKEGGDYTTVQWLPDSGVYRALLQRRNINVY